MGTPTLTIHASVPTRYRPALATLSGWWFHQPGHDKSWWLIRVRRWGVKFIATVHPADPPEPPPWRYAVSAYLEPGRTVIGSWPSVNAARDAAAMVIGADEERQCTPADIDRVRRENAERNSPRAVARYLAAQDAADERKRKGKALA